MRVIMKIHGAILLTIGAELAHRRLLRLHDTHPGAIGSDLSRPAVRSLTELCDATEREVEKLLENNALSPTEVVLLPLLMQAGATLVDLRDDFVAMHAPECVSTYDADFDCEDDFAVSETSDVSVRDDIGENPFVRDASTDAPHSTSRHAMFPPAPSADDDIEPTPYDVRTAVDKDRNGPTS